MAFPQRTFTEVPHDENTSPQMREFLNSLLSQVNALSGKGSPTSGPGIQALSVNTINPTTGQIVSAGARPYSITSVIGFTTSTTGGGVATITFFWDGTNGSDVFKVARDDGTQFGPNAIGSPLAVTGLAASTAYFSYPYFDENLQKIVFASVPGKSVGTPPIVFTAANFAAKAQQILRSHVPIAPDFGTTGITTPAANGSSSGSGGAGGGGGGGGGGHFR